MRTLSNPPTTPPGSNWVYRQYQHACRGYHSPFYWKEGLWLWAAYQGGP